MSLAAIDAADRWRLWRLGVARSTAAGTWHTARVGLIALVVLAPLPFASQLPLARSVLALVVALLLLLWTLAAALERDRISRLTPRLWPLVALFAAAPLWALVQTGSWTPRDWHSPLWQLARYVVPEVAGRITIDPHASGSAVMRLLTYGGVFWLAFQFGRSAGFARALITALAAAGVAYAAYGLVMHASGTERILWLPKPCCHGHLTSTFVNRNHYAPYAGVGLLCALGLLLSGLPKWWRTAIGGGGDRRALAALWWRAGWRGLAALALAVAVLLTHSRGGFAATVLGLATLLVALGGSGALSRRTFQASLVSIVLLGGALMYVVGGTTVDRIDLAIGNLATDHGGYDPGLDRFAVYGRIWQALGDAPLTGTGFGTFADAFRWYQGSVEGYYDYAHDTYLEAALELGVPVALGLIAAVAGAALICARGLGQRRRDRLYPALAVAAAVLLGSHALIDFSIQIPAVAVTFATLLGLGSAQSFGQSRRAAATLPRRALPNVAHG